jgi:uncharacterized membrane protein
VSDTSQGPGWWQASDGKWYPPEQAPGYEAPADGAAAGTLDFGTAFSWAWSNYTENIGPWITIVLALVVVDLVFFGAALVIGSFFVALLLRLVGYLVGLMIALGLIRASLASTQGQKPEVSMLFQTDHIGDYLIGTIIFAVAVWVGTILCCIPGILAYIFLSFYGFYIIDKDAGATDSLSQSFNLVKNNFGNAFVLLLLAWVLIIVGFATCGILLLVTGPLAYLLLAYGFRTLNGEPVAAAAG